LILAISKANFGWDGNELIRHVGLVLAVVASLFMSKNILDSVPAGSRKNSAKAVAALIAMPLTIHLLGIAIVNNTPGIGSL
jgi:hypothetical protein